MQFKGIKETCLYCTDLEKAREFYHEKLDLPIISYVENKHIFFRAGSSVLLIFNPEDSKTKISPPAHFAEGNQHVAFEVEEKLYQNWKEKIKDADIEIIDEVIWKNGKESFYFKDPEGNVCEIVPPGVWD